MRRAALVALLLAGCTGIYYQDFAVDSGEAGYPPRAQFEDIERYALERGLRVTGEGKDFARFELDAENTLEMRVNPEGPVQLTLMRISSGPGFSEGDAQRFQNMLAARIRERTGKVVNVRFVGARERPRGNVTFPGGFP
jgi:hypothetical protein